jgi:hypothetical protein
MFEGKRDVGADLIESFGTDAEGFRAIVLEARRILSQRTKSDSALQSDFVKMFRKNPSIRQGLEFVISEDSYVARFSTYQYLFSCVGRMGAQRGSLNEFVIQSLRIANQESQP